jgi:hypothetical protein
LDIKNRKSVYRLYQSSSNVEFNLSSFVLDRKNYHDRN